MAARRFVVFQDTPEAPSLPASTATHPPPNVLGPTTSEKENIHPLTGRAAFASKSSTQGTKEKITVLSTKFSVEDSVLKKKKKLVASDAGEDGLPEAKKLKASLSNGVPAKTKKSTGQRTTTSARPRKPTRRNVLPSLEEGAGDEETRVDSTQASINSRCVELTVKSLADVSEAFETTSAAATSTCSVESSESGNPLNLSTSVKHRDYFAVPLTSLTVTPLTKDTPAALESKPSNSVCSGEAVVEAPAFTTPERQKIYSAFTFSSPSPASKRLSEKPQSLLDIDTIALFERLTLDFKDPM
ncbi:hypothetical protein BDV98DRAFT_566271 [Pterulicium gracile]|uniref:Uncharacterized protein n=1 Tax=Pterulicium gracile TaxID=1884261 RepID=A0A5C3QQY9_9AGAR|nr:hypothetical protein BDV98DRAFT_566271 [Pterula gracilis]